MPNYQLGQAQMPDPREAERQRAMQIYQQMMQQNPQGTMMTMAQALRPQIDSRQAGEMALQQPGQMPPGMSPQAPLGHMSPQNMPPVGQPAAPMPGPMGGVPDGQQPALDRIVQMLMQQGRR